MKNKLKNAPHVDKTHNHFEDLIILAGAKAWNAWNKGKGEEWRLLCNMISADYRQKPVILGQSQLAEIERLRLAPQEQRFIKIFQYGGLKQDEITAICANIAQNTQAQTVTLNNTIGDLEEDLSAYIARIRNGDSVAGEVSDSLQAQNEVKRDPYVEERTINGQKGLYLFTPKFDRTTGENLGEKAQFLCDSVEVVGRGYDGDESYLILKFTPEHRNEPVLMAQRLAMVGERDGWQQLKSKGLRVTSNGTLKNILADHLQFSGKREEWAITNRTGWVNGAYLLPNGEIIGNTEKPTLFCGRSASHTGYRTGGTLKTWQSEVAEYARGNSSMMLAVAVALSAPLLEILDKDPFGVHIFGGSSTGKTTTAYIAGSVYGHPEQTTLTWYSTALALPTEASAHNDGLLVLDEIGQGKPKDVETVAYTLFNKTGKMQSLKDGGNRDLLRWRTVALSTGEMDLETYLGTDNLNVKAGQLVRLLNVPIKPAMHFNGLSNGNIHAHHLNSASKRNFGIIGRHWILWLSENFQEVESEYQKQFKKWLERLPEDSSQQVKRVADKFALLETALNLASFLTGWKTRENAEALTQSFNEWVNEFGMRSREESGVISQVTGFLQQFRSRFVEFPFDPNQRAPNNQAGYVVLAVDKDDSEKYHVFPAVFKGEVIKGFNERSAVDILHGAGMLTKSKEAKGGYTEKLSGRIDKSRPRVFTLTLLEQP